MKKRPTYLAALALVLVLSASIGSAWAYFTTHVTARGSHVLKLGDTTMREEPVVNWTKRISVTNQGDADSVPVYVRVKAFAGNEYPLQYSGDDEKWTPGADGYYYYSDILNGGETTSTLNILIRNVPEELKEAAEFDVAVVYERTSVLYDADGNPYADWSVTLDTDDAEGGAE